MNIRLLEIICEMADIKTHIIKPLMAFEIIPISILQSDYHAIRINVIKRIYSCLMMHNDFIILNAKVRDEYVIDIEESCYRSTIEIAKKERAFIDFDDATFVNIYSRQTTRIINHLDKESIVCDVVAHLLCGKINALEIADMLSKELMPDKFTEIEMDLNMRRSQTVSTKISTRYKCPKCQLKECYLQEVQTRSLDEGASLSARCKNCSYTWFVG